jgi:Cupin domain.
MAGRSTPATSPSRGVREKSRLQKGKLQCEAAALTGMVRQFNPAAIPAVHDLRAVEEVREREGYRQVVFRGLDVMMGYTTIGPSCADRPPHDHPWEQLNLLIDGELRFLVDDTVVELRKHHAMVIPPGVAHAARAAGTDATLLAVWPLREDRLEMTTYQTEFSE